MLRNSISYLLCRSQQQTRQQLLATIEENNPIILIGMYRSVFNYFVHPLIVRRHTSSRKARPPGINLIRISDKALISATICLCYQRLQFCLSL